MRRALAALSGLLALAVAAPAAAEPPVWRVRDKDSTITLFGSVHVLSEGLDWRTPALDAALASADEVWFETPNDPASQAEAVTAAQRRGRMPRNQKLTALLPKEGRALLAKTAQRVGMSMAEVDRLQPWFAEVVLSLADLQMRGARRGFGVEEQLDARIPATAQRRAFETPRQQIAMLAGQSLKQQAVALMQTLREMEEDPEAFTSLQAAWLRGDVAAIEREAILPMKTETPALYRRLVTERNRRWADEIQRLLKGSEQAFIVVGVGHLVGADGVPALLRRRGVVVEGP